MIHWLETHLSPCFFKSHFGIECPGCGMQRSFIALLKGNLMESLHYHPALIPFIITVLVLIWQLKFNHPKGANYVVLLFSITTVITVINYIVKLYSAFNH